jgi:predicted nucleic acid-binding protein
VKVVDASVVLKWVLVEEEGHEAAKELIPDHASGKEPIVIPELLFYEITNVLAVSLKLPLMQVEEIIEWFYELDLRIATLGRDDFKKAAKLAQQFHLSVYDASYVTLARSLDATLVTADTILIKRLQGKLIHIEHIA